MNSRRDSVMLHMFSIHLLLHTVFGMIITRLCI